MTDPTTDERARRALVGLEADILYEPNLLREIEKEIREAESIARAKALEHSRQLCESLSERLRANGSVCWPVAHDCAEAIAMTAIEERSHGPAAHVPGTEEQTPEERASIVLSSCDVDEAMPRHFASIQECVARTIREAVEAAEIRVAGQWGKLCDLGAVAARATAFEEAAAICERFVKERDMTLDHLGSADTPQRAWVSCKRSEAQRAVEAIRKHSMENPHGK